MVTMAIHLSLTAPIRKRFISKSGIMMAVAVTMAMTAALEPISAPPLMPGSSCDTATNSAAPASPP